MRSWPVNWSGQACIVLGNASARASLNEAWLSAGLSLVLFDKVYQRCYRSLTSQYDSGSAAKASTTHVASPNNPVSFGLMARHDAPIDVLGESNSWTWKTTA